MLSNEQIIEKYFTAFNSKDTGLLANILDTNISLEDWDGSFSGANEVVRSARELFTTFPQLKIDIRALAFSKNYASAEIYIQLDNANLIKVVDIFELEDGKIHKIRAYKC